jgi:glycosyltransferase involved in cell wall biosynthesis
MRILFLQQQPCMRTLKYAVGLRSARHGLELGFAYQGLRLEEWYGTGDDLFDAWWRIDDDPVGLRAVLDEFRPDVIHSHNLPDRLTVTALDVCAGAVPIVHDVHDMQSLRRTAYEDGFPEPEQPLALEREAVEGSAAVVAVSDEMLAELRARYTLPVTCRFANYAVGRDLPAVVPDPDRDRSGPPRIVYQGTLSTNGGHYDLRDVFGRLVAAGAQVDIYPSRPVPEYEALAARLPGLRCHRKLDPRRLLEVLPDYDFGWAGFNDSLNAAHLDTALPNKFFEYLGCGLPVLTTGHRAMSRTIAEHGVGIDIGTIDDLAAHLDGTDVAALRRRVADVRMEFTVEANIQPVVDLYKTVIG